MSSTTSSGHTYYSTPKSHQSMIDGSKSYRTLQFILEEKNKTIERLRKQVHNQRIQLKFYIRKEMNCPLMVDFAKSCRPELSNENMTIALAINKFYKEMGLKSRIVDVYDNVTDATSRTNVIIVKQEELLGEIISSIRQYMNPKKMRSFLGDFDFNTNYIEVFNSLLESTLSLKREMGTYRNTCDRLIATEEKRNEIVEKVYALPKEERTICNYLINLQMEKFELEHVIKQVACQQKHKDSYMDEIEIISNNLKVLHQNINELSIDNDLSVTAMLEKVYAQAMSLLTLSRHQRQKYVKEVHRLTTENEELRELLRHIDESREIPKRTKSAQFQDIEKLHNVIKKTISEAQHFEKVKSEELKKKSLECEKLKHQLDIVHKRQIASLQKSMEPIPLHDVERKPPVPPGPLSYKAQVETLQSIRDAYTASKK